MPRLVKKQRLLKALRSPNVTEETLQRCLEEGDSDVHRAMLRLVDLPRPIVEALRQNGANRAVRNLAGARLKSRKYRAST